MVVGVGEAASFFEEGDWDFGEEGDIGSMNEEGIEPDADLARSMEWRLACDDAVPRLALSLLSPSTASPNAAKSGWTNCSGG